ncbi:MAG: DUF2066 domain-containing protein [Parvularculaceae bacterium]
MTRFFLLPKFAVVAVISILLALGSSASAQERSKIYTVPKVPVRAVGDNTSDAQDRARDLGRRRAMDILLRRLTAEEDWVYLPKLALKRQASMYSGPLDPDAPLDQPLNDQEMGFATKQAVYIDPDELVYFEEGFAVFDEKASSKTYAASITYRFKPEKVRAVLKLARLPYSEAQTRMALIVPVLDTKSGRYLWETNNPWARAWLSRPLVNELTPMKLPRGDRKDVEAITPDQAMNFSQEQLNQLASDYGVGQVIIAHGYLTQEGGQLRLRVRLLDGFLGQVRGDANSTNAKGGILAEGWYRGARGDFPALARRGVESIVAKYAKDWKSRTIVDHSVTTTLTVHAWFDSLAEWTHIKSSLEKSTLIESTKAKAVTQTAATVEAVVLGDVKQLVLAMRERGLVLWTIDNVIWNIASPETYSVVRDRIVPSERVEEPPKRRRGFFRRRADGSIDEEAPLEQGTMPGFPNSAAAGLDTELDADLALEPASQNGTGEGSFLEQVSGTPAAQEARPQGPHQLEMAPVEDDLLDGLEDSLEETTPDQ